MDNNSFDVAVIGGGPAGLMAAGVAANSGAKVVLLEKNITCGQKLLITGSGACNLTNTMDKTLFLEGFYENGKFLYPAISTLSQESLLEFFRQKGVSFEVREDGKVFPSTQSSKTILDALINFCMDANVTIKTGIDIDSIKINSSVSLKSESEISNNHYDNLISKSSQHPDKQIEINKKKFVICCGNDTFYSDKIIVATGGLSYPKTGSTGSGFAFAKAFGHTIVNLRPALVGVVINEIEKLDYLSGVSLRNVNVELIEKNDSAQEKKLNCYIGDLLFTHTGVSGPCILYLSRFLAHDLTDGKSKSNGCSYFFSINFRQGNDISETDAILIDLIDKNPKKSISNVISSGFAIPSSFVKFMIAKAGFDCKIDVCKLTKINRKKIASLLHSTQLEILQTQGFSKAIITAGGVNLKEINPKTMESKLESGLFFAGEILDIDGFTGGYNLQAAFSTGYLAGISAGKIQG